MSEPAGTPDPDRWKALAVLGIAYLMAILDSAVVNVALPSIQEDLDFSPENLQWIVTGYALTFGGFLLLGGRLGDILGRRRVFIAGLVLFALFSLLAGLAVTSEMLIAMRFLQGAAGAILSPSVFSITSVTFREGAERNKALGALGALGGSGAAIGALLGGVLTQFAGWPWIFFVNVPIAAIAVVLTLRFVKESRAEEGSRGFDGAGALTVTTSLILFVFAVTQTTQVGWASAQTIITLIASGLLMALFLLIEMRSSHPLVPLAFFRKRTPSSANLVGLALGTAVFGTFFLLSLYMQQVLGFSALETGLGYLATSLTAIFTAAISQALVTRVGIKPVLLTGLGILAVGLAYLSQVPVDGKYLQDLLPGLLLAGWGLGFSYVPVSIAALSGITEGEAGLASGLINTSQQVGGALGLAILVTVANTRTETLIDGGTAESAAFTEGLSVAFWAAVGLAFAAFLMAALALRRDDLATTAGSAPPGA